MAFHKELSRNPNQKNRISRRYQKNRLVFPFIITLILLMNFSNIFFQLFNYSNPSTTTKNNNQPPSPFTTSSLLSYNVSSTSMELIEGYPIIDDLIQNSELLSNSNWTFTSSSNISSLWSSADQNAHIYHQSNASPDYGIVNPIDHAESVNLILYSSTSNNLAATYLLDGTAYGIREGGATNPYNINAQFIFNASLIESNSVSVNFFVWVSGDSFSWQIYNYLTTFWESIATINSLSGVWINNSVSQDPLNPSYINQQGEILLRIYDNDGYDTGISWFYVDYLEVRTNGTSGTPKSFSQIASINQTFVKDFETRSTQEVPSEFTYLFLEDFESGSLVTNEWDVYTGGGLLEISSITPYQGIYCVLFRGNSLSDPSTLSKSFNLNGLFNASLYYQITLESLESSDFLFLDVYDGEWHLNIRNYTGTFTYLNEIIDLSNYQMIDGFQIVFRGTMSSSTGDAVRLDNIIITGNYAKTPPVLLNFTYQVDQVLNADILLQVKLWNSTQFLGSVWSQQITASTNLIGINADISNKLLKPDVYNISFEVFAQISTPKVVNFSIHYDSIYIICQNMTDTTIQNYLSNVDDKALKFIPSTRGLDIRFNFSILEGNLSFFIHYLTLNVTTLWIYNFTSFSWVNSSNLVSPIFNWLNKSNIEGFDYVEDNTHIITLRYTNSSEILSNSFLLDYHSFDVHTYLSQLTHVQTSPTEVQPGATAKVQINLTSPSLNRPILSATILANYSEDQYLVQKLPNGIYNVTFYTDLASPGRKTIELLALKEGFDNSTTIITFNVTGFPSDICFISGVIAINETNYLEINPFPNDQTKEVQVYFNGSYGGIDGAVIQARLNITGKLMQYQDLGNTLGHSYDGFYNITVDTSGLSDGMIGRIDIKVIAEGYLSANLNFTFQVIIISEEFLELETDIDNITVIEGAIIRIGASITDLFHQTVLFNVLNPGNLTWRINSPDANILHNMDRLLTVYIADIDFNYYNITPGTYNLTIESWTAKNYANISKIIQLQVLSRENSSLNLLSLPKSVLCGNEFKIFANLTHQTGSPIVNTPITFNLRYEYRLLADFTEINEIRLTNSSGIAELVVQTPSSYKSVQIIVSYSGNNTVQNSIGASQVIPLIILNSSLNFSSLPHEILQGENMMISATLKINNTVAPNRTLTFRFLFDGTASTDQRTAKTDLSGTATITYTIPTGITKLEIEVIYEGTTYEYSNSTITSVNIISYATLILRNLPIILLFAGIILVVVLGYYINKRILHLTKFQKTVHKIKAQIMKNSKISEIKQSDRNTMLQELIENKLPSSQYQINSKNGK